MHNSWDYWILKKKQLSEEKGIGEKDRHKAVTKRQITENYRKH